MVDLKSRYSFNTEIFITGGCMGARRLIANTRWGLCLGPRDGWFIAISSFCSRELGRIMWCGLGGRTAATSVPSLPWCIFISVLALPVAHVALELIPNSECWWCTELFHRKNSSLRKRCFPENDQRRWYHPSLWWNVDFPWMARLLRERQTGKADQ